MIIYKWTNKINGKCYVGQTTKTLEHRTRMHVNSANAGSLLPLHSAIRKYGKDSFTAEQIDAAGTLEGLNILEEMYISKYDVLVPKGYNLAKGGSNKEWHPEMRAKSSRKAKERMIKDNGAQFKDMQLKGQQANKGRKPWNKGKKATTEAKLNQSKAHLGQVAWNKKPIICNETGDVFDSLHTAAKVLNVQVGHICSVLKGKRRSTGGYTFSYLNGDKNEKS